MCYKGTIMNRVRWTILGSIAAALAGALAYGVLRPLPISVARIGRGTAVEAVYASGTVEAVDRVEVKAQVAGPVRALFVREGDAVGRDQLLALIDERTLRYDVTRGRVDLAAARQRRQLAPQVAALEGQAQSLAAQLAQARADLERTAKLVRAGASAPLDLERARTQVASLEAQLSANRAQQQDVQITLHADAARQLAGVASLEARRSDAQVRAPMDGVVLARHVEPGEVVAVNQNLLRVGDLRHLWIEARVDEADIGRVRTGMPARIHLYAFAGQPLDGRVARILPDADRERKAFEVDVEVPGPAPELRPGMTAEINVVTKRHDGALLAPADAVRDHHVWLVQGRRLVRREVETGLRDLAWVEVLRGAAEGDLVALEDEARLRKARRVSPRPAAQPGP